MVVVSMEFLEIKKIRVCTSFYLPKHITMQKWNTSNITWFELKRANIWCTRFFFLVLKNKKVHAILKFNEIYQTIFNNYHPKSFFSLLWTLPLNIFKSVSCILFQSKTANLYYYAGEIKCDCVCVCVFKNHSKTKRPDFLDSNTDYVRLTSQAFGDHQIAKCHITPNPVKKSLWYHVINFEKNIKLQIFSHGQLYVGYSGISSEKGLHICKKMKEWKIRKNSPIIMRIFLYVKKLFFMCIYIHVCIFLYL